MLKTPPYTTRSGLRIGSAYEPKTRVEIDRDAARLQRALLGERPRIDADGIAIAVSVVTLVLIALVPFWSR